MAKGKKSILEPTKTLKNTLPKSIPSWNALYFKFLAEAKGIPQEIPKEVSIQILKAERELHLYLFDLEHIKAKSFEEQFPIVKKLFDSISGGKNYSRWEEFLRTFYNDFSKIVQG